MALTVREFKQNNPPRKRTSAMKPFGRQLAKMRNEGYTLDQMRQFLLGHSIDVRVSTISVFLTNWRKANSPAANAEHQHN